MKRGHMDKVKKNRSSTLPSGKRTLKTKLSILLLCIAAIVLAGFMIPEDPVIPVQDATENDWNHKTFWYETWGRSGVHKGIDIFAPIGRPVISATPGIVLYEGNIALGGNVVLVLGPKWRLHYYAHLKKTSSSAGQFLSVQEPVGEVGDTGNAKGKPSHLHYSILTPIPYPWCWDRSTQGWKKMFFINPSDYLLEG